MQDGVGVLWVGLEQLHGLGGGTSHQFYAAALRLGDDLLYDGQSALHAGADYQPPAFPGNCFPERNRVVRRLVVTS
jgi:hypothetical protein